MEWKRARVSQKRQVTIPQKMYEQLGIKDEVEFSMKDNQIIIRPVRENQGTDYFSDLILEDLIKGGYTGDQLLLKFREKKAEYQVAVKKMINDSGEAARHFKKTGKDETEELFGDVMEE